MNYKLLTYIRISLAIFIIKFLQSFGRGYEKYKIHLIEKKLDKIKVNPISYLDERIVDSLDSK